jgi:hypothetical protein
MCSDHALSYKQGHRAVTYLDYVPGSTSVCLHDLSSCQMTQASRRCCQSQYKQGRLLLLVLNTRQNTHLKKTE